MSKALDISDLIRTRFLTAPVTGELATLVDLTTLPEESVIVDRQGELGTKVKLAVAKAKGTAITILWTGFRTIDKNSKRPRLSHVYKIHVFSRPIIKNPDEWPADQVMDAVIKRLWQWEPGIAIAGQGSVNNETEILGGGLVPDLKYLIYDLDAAVAATL